jgi:secondary thiamine-phosphate synthase enzyme
METTVIDVDMSGRRLADLTEEARRFCRDRADGLLNVFVPHATAGVALFETGAGSEGDVLDMLERLVPRDDRYQHRHGSPGHGADHVVPAIVSPSVVIPVGAGELLLGTWQSIVLVDLNEDNPQRHVRLSFLGDSSIDESSTSEEAGEQGGSGAIRRARQRGG